MKLKLMNVFIFIIKLLICNRLLFQFIISIGKILFNHNKPISMKRQVTNENPPKNVPKIFKLKKMMRKGLYEKKKIKLVNRRGRWDKHEQLRFTRSCLQHGSNWKKVI